MALRYWTELAQDAQRSWHAVQMAADEHFVDATECRHRGSIVGNRGRHGRRPVAQNALQQAPGSGGEPTPADAGTAMPAAEELESDVADPGIARDVLAAGAANAGIRIQP